MRFEATWESLRQFECPAWFRDAKFGIWSHWGPQSVPMYGDWYARQIYIEGHDQYRYHVRKYGHPSAFGYKDIVKLWTAEKFDPQGLMDLYARAGAKYFVGQAVHHDNFFNWDSAIHRWTSVATGPRKDITGLWKAAAQKSGLPFGVSEHLATSFSWQKPNKGADTAGPYAGVPYDGNDPANEDLYLDNREAAGIDKEWYTTDSGWASRWHAAITELVEKYQPDLLYSDGGVPFGRLGLDVVSRLYNLSAGRNNGTNQAVYNQKDKDPAVHRIGVFDIERSQLPGIPDHVWQTDTSVGDWYYNVRDVYKTPKQVVEMLVDIVSKNGNLLLNVPQRPDGTVDDECLFLLETLSAWFKVNGEGIYGTRPWRTASEGPSSVRIEGFREDAVGWTIEDFRFTSKAGKVYAFLMKWPEGGRTVIRSLASGTFPSIKEAFLLGSGPVRHEQTPRGLAVELPGEMPVPFAACLRVT
jgi:alpha-L-fucosidase